MIPVPTYALVSAFLPGSLSGISNLFSLHWASATRPDGRAGEDRAKAHRCWDVPARRDGEPAEAGPGRRGGGLRQLCGGRHQCVQ